MKYPVRLFLGDMEVEFSQPPEILFNYSETELTNPTIVKNPYSKTVTIEGTAQNNKIFGHIYNFERIQGGYGSIMGSSFNPLVKTDFTLYYNGSVYESGYFKLDEIRRNDNNIEYDITLYGGLGDFFYNLSFREDGNNMELSDLTFNYERDNDTQLDFNINKETVAEAWNEVSAPSSKWSTINFAPCYNGIPDTLSTDRVLINTSGISDYYSTTVRNNYSIGVMSEKLTEWETFDLRSYLQRPVIRVKEVLDACFNSDNNGGYGVELDEDFFNPNNPYYWNAWMTLPLLTELDVPATVSTPLAVSTPVRESDYVYDIYDQVGNASNVSVDVQVKFNPSDGYTGSSIYLARAYWADGGITLQNRFIKTLNSDNFLTVQMVGYNSTGQIIAQSEMYYLYSFVADNWYFKPSADYAKKAFNSVQPSTAVNGVKSLRGKFTRKNGEYVWTDENGNVQTLRFNFPSDTEITDIKLKIVPYRRYYRKKTLNGGSYEIKGADTANTYAWSSYIKNSNAWQDEATVLALDRVQGSFSYVPIGATGTTTSFEGFYSNRLYSKQDLLTLGVTPAQFLLSYAKMFGLYFIKDCEGKTIRILTRHNFYQRDNIVNINDLVDKGSDITITPATPKYQYYDFGLEQVESEAAALYKKTYGTQYGTAVVNTGYQYEKEHKALLDGNIFRGGINVLEKDKYFLKPIYGNTSALVYNGPTYVNNGFRYWYVISANNTDEFSKEDKPMTGDTINPDGLRFYDVFPKPQFHGEANAPVDGSMVLLFFNDYADVSGIGYHLTDDTTEMYTLNDQTPCWIMTRGETDRNGTRIALTVNVLPHFTRDIYNTQGFISNSFDLGTPLTTYVPERYVTDWQSIYSKAWKSYISDLYSVNTRVLRCRCLLRERPNPEWLRRFYWFNNCYWRLNVVKDWNISSFDTTEMEFIKVQDLEDYDNREFSILPIVEWRLNETSINASGGTITGYIYVSDGSRITASDSVRAEYSDGSTESFETSEILNPTDAMGAIEIPVTLTIPENTESSARTFTISVQDDRDIYHSVEVEQGKSENEEPLNFKFYESGSVSLSGDTTSETIYRMKKNSGEWQTYSAATGLLMTVESGDTVYFETPEGKSINYFDAFFISGRCDVSGDMSSIFKSSTTPDLTGFFVGLPIVSAYKLKLPNTCECRRMFKGCTSLTTAPKKIPATTLTDRCYLGMFSGCTSLVNAPELPATTLADNCYESMFEGCTSLTTAPALPATTLASWCYGSMFSGCTSLVNAPALPATTLANRCYGSMFSRCTSLVNAPALPATTLASGCYEGMFSGCTSLVNAPALPATTLAGGCYGSMFRRCTSLVSAPALPAATLAQGCYLYMFADCFSLNYIKCLADEITIPFDYVNGWVANVSSRGTFVKKAGVYWSSGADGIPSGWTVVEE